MNQMSVTAATKRPSIKTLVNIGSGAPPDDPPHANFKVDQKHEPRGKSTQRVDGGSRRPTPQVYRHSGLGVGDRGHPMLAGGKQGGPGGAAFDGHVDVAAIHQDLARLLVKDGDGAPGAGVAEDQSSGHH